MNGYKKIKEERSKMNKIYNIFFWFGGLIFISCKLNDYIFKLIDINITIVLALFALCFMLMVYIFKKFNQ
jgi:hypothetical protein